MGLNDPGTAALGHVGPLRAPDCGISRDLQEKTIPAEASDWPNAAMHGSLPLDPTCYSLRVPHCTQLRFAILLSFTSVLNRFMRFRPASRPCILPCCLQALCASQH